MVLLTAELKKPEPPSKNKMKKIAREQKKRSKSSGVKIIKRKLGVVQR